MNKLFIAAAALATTVSIASAQNTGSGVQNPQGPHTQAGDRVGTGTGAGGMSGQMAADRTSGNAQRQPMDQQQAKEWIKDAASGHNFEIKTAQLAQDRAQNPEIKQHAQMIQRDHQQGLQQLKPIAQAMNVDVKDDLNEVHQAQYDKLSKLQGAAFDREFVFMNAGDHVKDILSYSAVSQDAQDPQLKQYATTQLPVLRRHEQMTSQTAMRLAGVSAEARPASMREGADIGASGSVGGASGSVGTGSRTNSDAATGDQSRIRIEGQRQPGAQTETGTRTGGDTGDRSNP